MAIGKLGWFREAAQTKSGDETKATGNKENTALYTYLDQTLKSPRLRRMLHESAKERASEAEVARRT